MQPHSPTGDPSVIVVMGVSGCGKSTIASMLAHRLHWIYEDGDWFHPQSNIKKMHHAERLTDEDRWPWLHAIAAWIDATCRRLPAFVANWSSLGKRHQFRSNPRQVNRWHTRAYAMQRRSLHGLVADLCDGVPHLAITPWNMPRREHATSDLPRRLTLARAHKSSVEL